MASELANGRHPTRASLSHRLAHTLSLTQRPWWPALKRTGGAVLLGLVLWLIVRQARHVDWAEVMASIREYPIGLLLAAAAMALASHGLYTTFDLLSRHHTGHRLPTARVLATTFVSYAFNLNFGSVVGGLAFRFRLYMRQGLSAGTVSRIFAFSMLTNWLGYVLLAGGLCLLQPIDVPEEWALGAGAMRVLGVVLVAAALGYVIACHVWPQREVGWRHLRLPSGRLALLQLLLSTVNWSLIGGVVWLLLRDQVAYPVALAVLLAAAVAGVVTHVPGGLGVLEAVFIGMLAPPLAQSSLLAALLVYRAIYYLIPLLLALVTYLVLELRLRRPKRPA